MKTKAIFTSLLLALCLIGNAQDPKEIVRKANDKMEGETSGYSEMSMQIIRPTWSRTVEFKNWTMGTDFAMTYITAPAQDKGSAFLKRYNDMWSWDPKISRMIKLPPSMMSSGWMGSDYSNDDVMKKTSIVEDFSHTLLGKEQVEGKECFKIELYPNDDANVVWGKMIMWISTDEYFQMKVEYFDEDEELVRTELAYDIKFMDDRNIPTRFEILPADEPGNKTVITMKTLKFNITVKESFFSQQNMKNLR